MRSCREKNFAIHHGVVHPAAQIIAAPARRHHPPKPRAATWRFSRGGLLPPSRPSPIQPPHAAPPLPSATTDTPRRVTAWLYARNGGGGVVAAGQRRRRRRPPISERARGGTANVYGCSAAPASLRRMQQANPPRPPQPPRAAVACVAATTATRSTAVPERRLYPPRHAPRLGVVCAVSAAVAAPRAKSGTAADRQS